MNWRVKLNGTDITAYCSGVQTRYEADAICGECEVSLASRAPLAGIIVPRVPQALAIAVDAYVSGAWVSRGQFFLEEIGYPQELDAKTATLWGRTQSAKLTQPWAQKISRQWAAETTTAEIMTELAALCGVSLSISQSYPVCQYCYAVSDQSPAEIIRDLASRSAMELWPMPDGSLSIAPRLYRDLPTPVVTLDPAEIVVDAVDRQLPEFGNRVLVSGEGSPIAGLRVMVVPVYGEDVCVAAGSRTTVRLIAVVLDKDGAFVAPGTDVAWSATGGTLAAETTQTGPAEVIGERHTADSYTQVTLDLPADAVIGVYDSADNRRRSNLYILRRGSVAGRTITFLQRLNYFDQSVLVDYETSGATNIWTAGAVPGDVTITAQIGGAVGTCVIHQSNPTACSSSIKLEASPSTVCYGGKSTIAATVSMFGGAGTGPIVFSVDGCGALSSTRKTLTRSQIAETLRTTTWGAVSQVRLTAVPVSGSSISITLPGVPADNLYQSHDGQTVTLDTQLPSGTDVVCTYDGGGTAMVTWDPGALPAGTRSISEVVASVIVGEAPNQVAQVALTHTPAAPPVCTPALDLSDYYVSHSGRTVTLAPLWGTNDDEILPAGSMVQCSYTAPHPLQPNCTAKITARVADGSQAGAATTVSVVGRDCRTVVDPSAYDPNNPDQVPEDEDDDGTGGPGDVSPDDPETWPEDDPSQPEYDPDEPDEPVTPTGCNAASILARSPSDITAKNWDAVAGVSAIEDCPGLCSCDQICAALRGDGRLGRSGYFYSQCMSQCNAQRQRVCTECTLTGPSTLGPGEIGTWTDDRGNVGQESGDLVLVSRTVQEGYKFRMPMGGSGPFTVRVCYGPQQQQCCEAQVDYAPCSLSGPTELSPGDEAYYIPSAGLDGAACVCGGDMEFVRMAPLGTAFVCRMRAGGCAGTVTVNYGGQVCGTIDVTNPMQDYVGAVSGPATLEPGETAIYYHDLGPGATYTGTLPGTPFSGELGHGITGTMPGNATSGQSFTVSFAGACGSTASMTVSPDPCSGGPVVPEPYAYTCGEYIQPGAVYTRQGRCFRVTTFANRYDMAGVLSICGGDTYWEGGFTGAGQFYITGVTGYWLNYNVEEISLAEAMEQARQRDAALAEQRPQPAQPAPPPTICTSLIDGQLCGGNLAIHMVCPNCALGKSGVAATLTCDVCGHVTAIMRGDG